LGWVSYSGPQGLSKRGEGETKKRGEGERGEGLKSLPFQSGSGPGEGKKSRRERKRAADGE